MNSLYAPYGGVSYDSSILNQATSFGPTTFGSTLTTPTIRSPESTYNDMYQHGYYDPLVIRLGQPSYVEQGNDGKWIWIHDDLINTGYGFLHRVEKLNRPVVSKHPVVNRSNVMVSKKMGVPKEQHHQIINIFPNCQYDQERSILTIRSDNFDSCLGQMAIIILYVKGKLKLRQIKNHDLILKYHQSSKRIQPKVVRQFYKICSKSEGRPTRTAAKRTFI